MGNINSNVKFINYEDVQYFQKLKNSLIISTLSINNQNCLIKNTCNAKNEEASINNFLETNKDIHIVIYGMNSSDKSVFSKEKQLSDLGFNNIFIYSGGLFEWLLLQDIYGNELFMTTQKELDILKYKSSALFN